MKATNLNLWYDYLYIYSNICFVIKGSICIGESNASGILIFFVPSNEKFSKIWSSICSYICLCRVTLWLITGQFSILVILEKKLNDIKHREYAHTWLLSWIYSISWKACSLKIWWWLQNNIIRISVSILSILYFGTWKHYGRTVKC